MAGSPNTPKGYHNWTATEVVVTIGRLLSRSRKTAAVIVFALRASHDLPVVITSIRLFFHRHAYLTISPQQS